MDKIQKYATMLYGIRWQRGLAEDMGIHRTSIAKGFFRPEQAKSILIKQMQSKIKALTKGIQDLE